MNTISLLQQWKSSAFLWQTNHELVLLENTGFVENKKKYHNSITNKFQNGSDFTFLNEN